MNTEYFEPSRGSGLCAVVGFLVSAVVLFAASQADGAVPGCVPAPGGLVSWWPAEGNANETAGEHHGALFNGVTFAAGTVGQAFSFDGTNDYVEVPDSPALRLTNELTIEFWVKRQRLTFPSSPYADYIVEKGGDTTGGVQNYGVALHNPQYNHCLHFTFAGGWRGAGSVADLNWHHCAVVARHGQADPTFYVDGVQQPVVYRQGAGTINLYPSTRPLHIGAQIDPVSRWYYYSKTLVDELALYNRALSASEIQAIYTAGSAGKCPPTPACVPAPSGLISWWRAENSTADAVGGNNGAIAGTGTVTYGAGIVGQAFVFDGTHRDRVDLGNPATLQLEDFTLEAWVKRSSSTVTSFDILGADGSICGDGACIIGCGRGGYIFALANDGRMILSRTDLDGLLSAPLVTDTTWHHLAVTKSGSSAVFYLDGVPQATPAYVHPHPYTFDDATCACNAAIAIGSRGDARGGTFFGMIDEPAVFNRALSASEIQSIYNAGSAGKCASTPTPVCVPAPDNLVSWWRGEGNASDAVDGNHGTMLNGVTFAGGEVGQAFYFDGLDDRVLVPNAPGLNFGPGQNFSIEAWIQPQRAVTAFGVQSIVDKRYTPNYLAAVGYAFALIDGKLSCQLADTPLATLDFTTYASSGPDLRDGQWHHVAMTVDRPATNGGKLYVDGNVVLTFNPTLQPGDLSTSQPLRIGNHADPALNSHFKGRIDEVAIYNRTLSPADIQAICAAGSAGKCHEPPMILTQPVSQKVTVGLNATFSVVAGGTPPLRYQWRFNGVDLPSATASTLSFAVGGASGGSYSVRVTNAFGYVTSTAAVLEVNHPPVADASATLPLVISANNTNASVVLNGSRSSDAEGDPLQYDWFEVGAADPLATGVVAVVTLPVGSNALTLTVSDGLAANSQTFAVEVITPAQAAERLVALAASGAGRSQPLIATLSAALAAIDRSNPTAAINQLQAFQNQVRAQVSPLDPELAEIFIQTAQDIIDALIGGSKAHGKITLVSRAADGTMRLHGEAAPGARYIIEASTNLVDWERIGVTTGNSAEAFEFQDTSSSPLTVRFYRVVSP